jgi:hypothetical protein
VENRFGIQVIEIRDQGCFRAILGDYGTITIDDEATPRRDHHVGFESRDRRSVGKLPIPNLKRNQPYRKRTQPDY